MIQMNAEKSKFAKAMLPLLRAAYASGAVRSRWPARLGKA